MASILDASNALKQAIADALYPTTPSGNSVAGMPVKVYVGWPIPHQLDADLAAGTVNVSVYNRPGDERVTTRYMSGWQVAVDAVATLTATMNGHAVTIAGTVSTPQVVAAIVQGIAYIYDVQANDTLNSVAAGLATVLQVDYPTTSAAGAVVTLPNSANLQAVRIGASGTVVKELRRQEKGFQVTVWAHTPTARDAVGSFIDEAFGLPVQVAAPDQTNIKIEYRGSSITDEHQKTVIYRHDFMLTVEYATATSEDAMQIIAPVVNLQAQPTSIP